MARRFIVAAFLVCASVLLGLAQESPVVPLSPRFNTIGAALQQPWGKAFWIERKAGKYRMGDTASKFFGNTDFADLTFDISNNKALANVGVQGTIQHLTIYRDSYRVTSHPDNLPGVWMAKDNSSFGPYSYKLQIGSETYDLAKVDWDFRTGLLDNIFPITELRDPQGRFLVRLLTYAPVSSDGSERLRGVVYGLQLENRSDQNLRGEVELPETFEDKRQDFTTQRISMWEPFEFEFALGDSTAFQRKIKFTLAKNESVWVPTILYMPGDPTPQEVSKKGTVAWLGETWAYYRHVLGRLRTPADDYLAEFFERQVMQALQSIAMSASGKVAGTNWGSYPATREIWMKDAYYSCLPITLLDPSLAPQIILWFNEFGVRQKGNVIPGGLDHSLSLSVASIVLGGQYYDHTGDKVFFIQHPELKRNWDNLLEQMIASRPDEHVWLFPTRYISDGAVEGDYHTGTNVVAWRALRAYSRLLKEVYDEPQPARRYSEIADKVYDAILAKTVIDGPFGKQFIEAVHRDGKPPLMISDGEESDTTLMPFYGFLPYDDETYLHYMHFSMSEYNRLYQPKVRAISWANSPATPLDDRVPSTAPGYMKGIAFGNDPGALFGEHGYYSEVRRITDADGSIWWWSYGWNSNPPKWSYDDPVRLNIPGKSGWFAGVHTAVFISRYLGVVYDAPTQTLRFAPSPLLGKRFKWADFPMGEDHFSVSYEREGSTVLTSVTNESGKVIHLEAMLPVDGLGDSLVVSIAGIRQSTPATTRYLGRDSIRVLSDVAAGKTITIAVSGK